MGATTSATNCLSSQSSNRFYEEEFGPPATSCCSVVAPDLRSVTEPEPAWVSRDARRQGRMDMVTTAELDQERIDKWMTASGYDNASLTCTGKAAAAFGLVQDVMPPRDFYAQTPDGHHIRSTAFTKVCNLDGEVNVGGGMDLLRPVQAGLLNQGLFGKSVLPPSRLQRRQSLRERTGPSQAWQAFLAKRAGGRQLSQQETEELFAEFVQAEARHVQDVEALSQQIRAAGGGGSAGAASVPSVRAPIGPSVVATQVKPHKKNLPRPQGGWKEPSITAAEACGNCVSSDYVAGGDIVPHVGAAELVSPDMPEDWSDDHEQADANCTSRGAQVSAKLTDVTAGYVPDEADQGAPADEARNNASILRALITDKRVLASV